MKDLTVVIRIHKPNVLGLLKECLFSLQGCSESHRIKILFVCQNFEGQENELKLFLDRYSLEYKILTESSLGDLRSLMLKRAFEDVDTKYLTILDYDDVTSVHGYEYALKQLAADDDLAAVFGRIDVYSATWENGARCILSKQPSFYADDFFGYREQNRFSIHGCVMNVKNIPSLVSYVHPSLVALEDYHIFYQVIVFCKVEILPQEILMGNYYRYGNLDLNTNQTSDMNNYSEDVMTELKKRTTKVFYDQYSGKLVQWDIPAAKLRSVKRSDTWARLSCKQKVMLYIRYGCYKLKFHFMKLTR